MVEFGETSIVNLEHFHTVATSRGTLGLITLNNDVFLCVITGSEEVATVRPLETVQKIFAVEFCELVEPESKPALLTFGQTVLTERTMIMHMGRTPIRTPDRYFTRMTWTILKAMMSQNTRFTR